VPATNSTAPKIKRNLPALEPSVTAGTGRIASSGETRIACEAGNHEATTVITTPATSTQIIEASIPKVAPAIQFRASARSPNIRRHSPLTQPSETADTGRIASSSDTRIAYEAGNHEATTVITTPATSTQIIEASIPKVAPAIQFRASASSPNIRPTAAKIPTTDPMSPISTDSANTALRIWPRVAPNTRCRAYCLVRWATKTENVLLMTNI